MKNVEIEETAVQSAKSDLDGNAHQLPHVDNLASIWKRALAQMIDFTILGSTFVVVTYLVRGVWLLMPGDHLWIIFDPICGVFLVAIFAYFIGMEGRFGSTLGKLATRLRVVDEKGQSISMSQSVKRNLGRLVDGIGIYAVGVRMARESPLRQRYGDKTAKTVVIHVGLSQGTSKSKGHNPIDRHRQTL
ncbi:MAG: RDD family protein [Candidatus Thorarchaeota archaeon]|nr:MAG: RDD family protein [Candidatus Thorarchaeota archaeon]